MARDLAKEFEIGSVRMLKFLREKGALDASNLPYQRHINARRFFVEMTHYKHPDGSPAVNYVLRITPKGEFYIRSLLLDAGWPTRAGVVRMIN